jgi:CheY-like chemotaxis protein
LEQLFSLMETHDKRADRPAAVVVETKPAEPSKPISVTALLETLGNLVAQLDEVEQVGEDPALGELYVEQLAELTRRLEANVGRLGQKLKVAQRAAAGAATADWPRNDPVLDPLWSFVQERGAEFNIPISLFAEGDTGLLGKGLHDVIGEILKFLLMDVCACFARAMHEDEDFDRADIRLEIRADRGRIEIVLRDSAPAVNSSEALTGTDALAFYRGVRRARPLIHQLDGILQVEPSDRAEARFLLRLPADLTAQTYQLIKMQGQAFALPWVRVIEHLPSQGLVFEADEFGESFVRGGSNVPLMELTQFVPALLAQRGVPQMILVVGNVERRLGLYCDEIGELIQSNILADPPAGWEKLAYGSVELDGQRTPILDIPALLQLREETAVDASQTGGGHDTLLDSYIAEANSRAITLPRRLKILVVNRSEFRRRDISRVLQRFGHELNFSDELLGALKRRERPEVDLIITDLRLGEEGMEDLGRVKAVYGGVPVVLTSSAAREQADELAGRVGADGCWLDPYRPEDLRVVLDRLFE